MKHVLLLFLGLLTLTSCASFGRKLKAFVGGEDTTAITSAERASARFSNTPNLPVDQKRRLYRRMTKDSFEQQGMLEEGSGSLWVMEGQGSYLFSQNIIRVVGDLVNVQLEGGPRSQLTAKVDVIKKLLEKTRKDTKRELASAAEAAQKAQEQQKDQNAKPEGAQIQTIATSDPNRRDRDDDKDDEVDPGSFDVGLIPARIIEKSNDGSYRIKGSQQFMIGRKEYKVIVTGMVRSGDIDSDTIQASKVLDPRFDIVSMKKEATR
jgi:flagellar L-ring protein FlgH